MCHGGWPKKRERKKRGEGKSDAKKTLDDSLDFLINGKLLAVVIESF